MLVTLTLAAMDNLICDGPYSPYHVLRCAGEEGSTELGPEAFEMIHSVKDKAEV